MNFLAKQNQSIFARLLAAALLLAVSALNCARSYPEGEVAQIQATLNASSALPSEEPGWFREMPGALTAAPGGTAFPTITPEVVVRVPTSSDTPTLIYYAQSGDTLKVLATRFGVSADEIESDKPFAQSGFIRPEHLLIIPNALAGVEQTPKERLLPDSELVYGPSNVGFNVEPFVEQAGGYLSKHRQWLESTRMNSGAQVVQRVAIENSINPRLLLAVLEYQSGWVNGQPKDLEKLHYPLGTHTTEQKDLFRQLEWAANALANGYYGWREGHLTELKFADGASGRLAPDLNAGTVALQFYFSQVYDEGEWRKAIDPKKGVPALYVKMFGDPWMRAKTYEPIFPEGIMQPELSLPFEREKLWAYTGGPHPAWERDGAWAALDFAPGSLTFGCVRSDAWVLAAAPGIVTRSENGIVALDLDGDGSELTGWVLLYLHIAKEGSVKAGTPLDRDDKIGHPSCEGGIATGTHLHFARKYNGEWIAADGALPFDLGGWVAHSDGVAYKGTLTRAGKTIIANTTSPSSANVIRGADDL